MGFIFELLVGLLIAFDLVLSS